MKHFFEQIEASTGNPVKQIRIASADFQEFKTIYKDGRPGVENQKLLEYFISYRFLDFSSSDVYIDVAAQDCPFAFFVGDTFGCQAYRQDLYYMKRGIHGRDIGGDASRLPLGDGSVSKISLHNSFEHFEGSSDIRFIREAQRALGIGGKMIIVPVFFEDKYRIQKDSGWVDENKKKHLWGKGARFSRFYDPGQFDERIVRNSVSMNIQFYFIENIQELSSDCYGQLFAIFEKTSPTPPHNRLSRLLDFLR